MVLWTRSMEDRRAFRCLFYLAVLYGLASWLVYVVLHMRHVQPLGMDAPLNRFSEARAVEHVRQLTVGTGGRQVSTLQRGLCSLKIHFASKSLPL